MQPKWKWKISWLNSNWNFPTKFLFNIFRQLHKLSEIMTFLLNHKNSKKLKKCSRNAQQIFKCFKKSYFPRPQKTLLSRCWCFMVWWLFGGNYFNCKIVSRLNYFIIQFLCCLWWNLILLNSSVLPRHFTKQIDWNHLNKVILFLKQ